MRNSCCFMSPAVPSRLDENTNQPPDGAQRGADSFLAVVKVSWRVALTPVRMGVTQMSLWVVASFQSGVVMV